MPPTRIAVFPGSFDPLTNGHIDLIQRAARLFDHIIVAVLVNPDKRTMFTPDERVAMIELACGNLHESGTVKVDAFEGLLVQYAASHGACAIIRGLRSSADFDYERPQALMNAHLAPTIETVCLLAANTHAHISSRLVKEVASLGGAVSNLVPPSVESLLLAKLKGASTTRA